MDYKETLKWIHSIGRFGIKPGLERMEALLERLGSPHEKLRFVHIAGTNGKGSTAAMLASVIQAGGYRAGLYTSPYLMEFNNRIGINGADISPRKLVSLANRLRPVVEEIAKNPELGQPTEFEVVTTLALCYYAMEEPDIVVMEVGLGGRLDATNIITPLVSVITNVSLDHTHVLGSTVEEIAAEKAGIIKEKVPVISAAEDYVVDKVIESVSAGEKAPLYKILAADNENVSSINPVKAPKDKIFFYSNRKIFPEGQMFSFKGISGEYDNIFTPLRGSYQIKNAATALAASQILSRSGFILPEKRIKEGLKSVNWPGRMEVLNNKPLIVIDGAHNPAAINKLAQGIKEHFRYNKMILVMGIMEDKDCMEILKGIINDAGKLILTRPEMDRAADPHSLKASVEKFFSLPVIVEAKIKEAVKLAVKAAGEDDIILITGSFYTISEAREHICKDNLTIK